MHLLDVGDVPKLVSARFLIRVGCGNLPALLLRLRRIEHSHAGLVERSSGVLLMNFEIVLDPWEGAAADGQVESNLEMTASRLRALLTPYGHA